MLCVVRKWWRPAFTWTGIGTIVANCIYIPIANMEPVSLTDLAVLFAAFSPFFITRAVEKKVQRDQEKGIDNV